MSWRLSLDELRAHGDRIALRGAGPEIGYGLLASRAEAVADALTDLGVAPGERVALLSQRRRHDEAVALAGILAAGAVVVPLDPSSPPARLERIARGARVVVHDEGALGAWQPQLGRLELDEGGSVLASMPAGVEAIAAPATDLAAVLHTSGSTGTPKPVPIRWEGLDAFTAWMIGLTALASGDRVLRVAELVFDLAWFDHLASFRAGATLCTLARRELTAGRALAEATKRHDPHVIYAVPALFSRLVAADGIPPSLRVACYAGEIYPPAELARLVAVAPRVFNLFGPTETNVCTFHEVRPEDAGEGADTPIGRATPYADCRLIDAGRRVEGPGIGELWVAGPTALGGDHATGDRVERDAEGLFRFRGRIDRLVKIRGYRVDPGEVEAALGRHPWVREAAVLPANHPRLGRILVAYVGLREGDPSAAPRVLRKHLSEQIPPSMVPDRVDVLDALPRSVTGKIDYSTLAAR